MTQNTLQDSLRLECKFWVINGSAGLSVCFVICKARSLDEVFYKVKQYREVDRKAINCPPCVVMWGSNKDGAVARGLALACEH